MILPKLAATISHTTTTTTTTTTFSPTSKLQGPTFTDSVKSTDTFYTLHHSTETDCIMAASSSAALASLGGTDIAKLLTSKGPVVKCVLLSAESKDATTKNMPSEEAASLPPTNDAIVETPGVITTRPSKAATAILNENDDNNLPERIILRDLMKEIEVDMTPSKSMVAKTLGGGPITFLGQYEDEGIVLVARNLPPGFDVEDIEELEQEPIAHLKQLCQERDISLDKGMLEKSDLIKALISWSEHTLPPINPHYLQPPLHREEIRGDILILKVAETKEELDDPEDEEEREEANDDESNKEGNDESRRDLGEVAASDATTNNENSDDKKENTIQIGVPTNDEFFLDYTLEEYIKFASRTDIPEDESDSDDSNEAQHDEGEEDDDEEEDEDTLFQLGDTEEIPEEDKAAMFNLVMNEVLRQYREEHGRGPNTLELLELRSTMAKELNIPVAEIDSEQADWDKNAKDGTPAKEAEKTIGFSAEDKVLTYEPDPNEYSNLDADDDNSDDDYEDDENEDDEDENEKESEELMPPKKKIKTAPLMPEEEIHDSKPSASGPSNS